MGLVDLLTGLTHTEKTTLREALEEAVTDENSRGTILDIQEYGSVSERDVSFVSGIAYYCILKRQTHSPAWKPDIEFLKRVVEERLKQFIVK